MADQPSPPRFYHRTLVHTAIPDGYADKARALADDLAGLDQAMEPGAFIAARTNICSRLKRMVPND